MQQPDAIAIIPARGGSKGIPRKNIRPFCGKPLIAWTIEAAQAAAHIGRIVVSTDDPEIAGVATTFGAESVMRPAELAGDMARSEDALLHTLDTLYPDPTGHPDVLAFLQCTSPLLIAADIDGTIARVSSRSCDTAVTVTDFRHFIWEKAPSDSLHPVNHSGAQRLMRQECPPQVLEVGAVYAMDCAQFMKHRFRFFGTLGSYSVPASRAFEIDTEEDWLICEALMRAQLNAVHTQPSPTEAGLDGMTLTPFRAVVTDFDGVLTDNRVLTNAKGQEWVACNRSDGWGIRRLRESGYPVVCLSSETDPVVAERCAKLGIKAITGQRSKQEAFIQICRDLEIEPSQVIYVGNDVNDIDCMDLAGMAIAPADGSRIAMQHANVHTRTRGGEGVLREIAEAILGSNGLEEEKA